MSFKKMQRLVVGRFCQGSYSSSIHLQVFELEKPAGRSAAPAMTNGVAMSEHSELSD